MMKNIWLLLLCCGALQAQTDCFRSITPDKKLHPIQRFWKMARTSFNDFFWSRTEFIEGTARLLPQLFEHREFAPIQESLAHISCQDEPLTSAHVQLVHRIAIELRNQSKTFSQNAFDKATYHNLIALLFNARGPALLLEIKGFMHMMVRYDHNEAYALCLKIIENQDIKSDEESKPEIAVPYILLLHKTNYSEGQPDKDQSAKNWSLMESALVYGNTHVLSDFAQRYVFVRSNNQKSPKLWRPNHWAHQVERPDSALQPRHLLHYKQMIRLEAAQIKSSPNN